MEGAGQVVSVAVAPASKPSIARADHRRYQTFLVTATLTVTIQREVSAQNSADAQINTESAIEQRLGGLGQSLTVTTDLVTVSKQPSRS